MKYGYAENKGHLLNRLKRIEGQVRGVAGMVESDEYCIDILTQISAIEAAMDKVAIELLRDHTKYCLVNAEAGPADSDVKIEEIMQAVNRLLRK